jgi:hypothetical protein
MGKRLVIDKLLDQEVFGKVQITEQELAGIYQQHSSVANTESSVKNPDQEARLVELLRREKAEALLEQLMKSIRSTYKIEINEEAVEDLIGQ